VLLCLLVLSDPFRFWFFLALFLKSHSTSSTIAFLHAVPGVTSSKNVNCGALAQVRPRTNPTSVDCKP